MKKMLLISMVLITGLWSGCMIDEEVEPEDPRDKFLGEWNVSEECIRLNYTVYISYNPDNSSQVLIENFGNPGPGFAPVPALVVNNRIYVDNEETGDNWIVNGQGTFTNGKVDWDYTIALSGTLLTCSSTYTR